MQEGTTASVTFPPASAKDVLTELLREGAQQMLATAIEAEVADWIESHAHLKDENGHRQVVRNGYLPERNITTGVGDVPVRQPRVHDRRSEGEKEKYSSKILPPYLRKTKSIEWASRHPQISRMFSGRLQFHSSAASPSGNGGVDGKVDRVCSGHRELLSGQAVGIQLRTANPQLSLRPGPPLRIFDVSGLMAK